jgi:1,2-phenylacetyl-CoA epoxidase catalytic subunit
VATLALAIDESAGLVPGYQLKLNSYDLGADIELNDALNRIRFEHSQVGAVVVTSRRDKVFCSGANIFMLGLSSHAWKVNFCKFTNETRHGIEDSSAHSGLKFIAAVNGGYELALAAGSPRPAGTQGVRLAPLQRVIEADALRYPRVQIEIDRKRRVANWPVRGPSGALPDDAALAPTQALSEANFGCYLMATGQSRLGRRFYDEAAPLAAVRAALGQPLDADAAHALGLTAPSMYNPRILGAFNEATPDWLSFFMFTYFTDRDGKFQLCALAESAFDPLARTTKFMLTEEARHMFVGESGISRVIQRTAQKMNELKTDEVGTLRAAGVIDLPTLQRYINFHFSVTIDLFGADQSSNAATFYSSGLKGQYEEGKRVDDYVTDSVAGVNRWNKVLDKAGIPTRLSGPHKAFHRNIGGLAGIKVSPDGRVVSEAEWKAQVDHWLPSATDRAFVASLMGRVVELGQFAHWIAAPMMGINRQPVEFDHVRFN